MGKRKKESIEVTPTMIIRSTSEPTNAVQTLRTREQVHSKMFTDASYTCSSSAQRIKYNIVCELNKQRNAVAKKYNYNEEDIRNELLRMPNDTRCLQLQFDKTELLEDFDKHEKRLKDALDEIYNMSFDCEYGEPVFNEETKEWEPGINHVFRMISSYTIDKRNNKVHISLTPTAYRIIMDFSRLYSTYDLNIIKKFQCLYSCRFYEMFYNLDRELTFDIDTLKKRFLLEDKYKRPYEFYRVVVMPALEEIEKYSPKIVECTPIYSSNGKGKGRKGITHLKFTPKDNPNIKYEEEHKEIISSAEKKRALKEKRISIAQALPNDVLHTLKNTFSFSDTQINNNASLLNLWVHYTAEGDRSALFARIASAHDVKNWQAYTIGTIKREVLILEEQETKRRNYQTQTPLPQKDNFGLPYDGNELPF